MAQRPHRQARRGYEPLTLPSRAFQGPAGLPVPSFFGDTVGDTDGHTVSPVCAAEWAISALFFTRLSAGENSTTSRLRPVTTPLKPQPDRLRTAEVLRPAPCLVSLAEREG